MLDTIPGKWKLMHTSQPRFKSTDGPLVNDSAITLAAPESSTGMVRKDPKNEN